MIGVAVALQLAANSQLSNSLNGIGQFHRTDHSILVAANSYFT